LPRILYYISTFRQYSSWDHRYTAQKLQRGSEITLPRAVGRNVHTARHGLEFPMLAKFALLLRVQSQTKRFADSPIDAGNNELHFYPKML